MAIISIPYNGLADRAAKITANESQKLRMLSDDFAAGWNPSQEIRGIMQFTDIPEVQSPPPVDWKALYKAAVTLEARIVVLASRLGLE